MEECGDVKSTREIFREIYVNRTWGGRSGESESGGGSRPEYAIPYCRLLECFIGKCSIEKGFDSGVTVVDLGCGDFRVGRELVRSIRNIHYIGVDIVPELIQHNVEKYRFQNADFICLDIVEDELPDGDLCLIRQVLQHLSNNQIKKALKNISKYRYIFITEHYPAVVSSPNLDKLPGKDTRRGKSSAVCLDQDPFNIPGVELVLNLPYADEGTPYCEGQTLRTFKIENIGMVQK